MSSIPIIDRGRGPELADTRITVFDVLPYLQAGWSQASIALVFNLSSAQVAALSQYIEAHQEAVLATQQKIRARIAQGNPPEIEAKRRASHAKLLALRDAVRKNGPIEGKDERHSG
jgi:uncharacterized protein (DUF433 family)